MVCDVIGLGGRGETQTSTEATVFIQRAFTCPRLVTHSAGSSAIQPLAATVESWQRIIYSFVAFGRLCSEYELTNARQILFILDI